MKQKVVINAIIPLNKYSYSSQHDITQREYALKELQEIIDNETFDLGFEIPKIKIKYKKGMWINKSSKSFFLYKNQLYTDNDSVTLSSEFSFQISKIIKFHKRLNHDNDIHPESIKFLIADEFSTILYELLFILNISRPGSLSSFEGVIFIDGIVKTSLPGFSNITSSSYEYSLDKKYPQFSFINSITIRKWLIETDSYLTANPQNKISIAINCLSYIFDYDLINSDKLIYCLLGLESLYSKGTTNIVGQLNEKIQVYLGPLKEFKKLLKEMYSVRSRFLHGDFRIKPYNLYENTDINNYESDIYYALLTGIGILICTIQKMILENRVDLNFNYRLESNATLNKL